MKKISKAAGIVLGLGTLYLSAQSVFAQPAKSDAITLPDFKQVTGQMLQDAAQLKETTPIAPTNFFKVIDDVTEYQAFVAAKKQEKNRPSLTGPETLTVGFGKTATLADYKAVAADGKKANVTFFKTINTKQLGAQEAILKSEDSNKNSRYKVIKVNVVDQTAPKLSVKTTLFATTAGESVDIMAGVTAADLETGDLTAKISHTPVDFSKAGTQTITYTVADTAKHTATATAKINVTAPVVQHTTVTNSASNAQNNSNSASSATRSASNGSTTTAAATNAYQPNHIYMSGTSVAYANGGQGSGQQLINGNPYGTASTYYGSSFNGTDGNFTHFIGHAPGVFAPVLGLSNGSAITVTDANGTPFTYHVYQSFNLPMTTENGFAYPSTTLSQNLIDALYYNEVGGETIVLQTCLTAGGSIIKFVYAR